MVIISNAIYLGIQVESIDPTTPPGPQPATLAVHLTYAIIFSFEVVLRFTAAGPRQYVCGLDWAWNWLDMSVVFSSWTVIALDFLYEDAADTGVSSSIRIVRIIRASRLLRILRTVWVIRFVGALRTLVSSLVDTLRSLFWALLLLFLIMYVFGILFTDVVLEHMQAEGVMDPKLIQYFGSLYTSIATLFRSISGGLDWEAAADSLNPLGIFWVQVFQLYVAFVSFAVLNVMTGVFCNSAIKSAERDQKAKLEDRHDFRALMMKIFKQIDSSGDGKLTLTEFESLFDSEAMKALMETAEIKATDAWTLFTSLDQDGDNLVDVNEFIERCLQLHGPARALDLHSLTRQNMKLAEQLATIELAQKQQMRMFTLPLRGTVHFQDENLEDLRYNWDWWRAKVVSDILSVLQTSTCVIELLPGCIASGWAEAGSSSGTPRYAYVCVVWGASDGYALGASVLGKKLQELQAEQGESADLILMHTDDVPENYLEQLAKIWNLQSTEYIDGVSALYTTKGTRFDGVFTKLSAWKLVEYDKVILLDIDTLPLKPLSALFELEPPAALVRGSSDMEHGAVIDGRCFFSEGDGEPGGWLQSGGINAGVILLRPSLTIFEQMLSEVTSQHHPAHIAGNGPEQDYLTRFFAARVDTPWRHIDVSYNFQLHHIPFALEQVVRYRNQLFESEASDWLPRRLSIDLEDIKLVHFSGELKYWHMTLCRGAEMAEAELCMERFVEQMLAEFASYGAWVTGEEDCVDYGAQRRDGRIVLAGNPMEDITDFVARAFQHARTICAASCNAWHSCALRLLQQLPGLLHELDNPRVPQGCAAVGAEVEVLWPDEGSTWHPARVCGVHADGTYTVHYYTEDRSWSSCKERNVSTARVRALGA
ncbi:unnamed protein product [Symbiodinium pilosum]|uniref:EF-hand domain-containing protein n=1 Tax=Symbiodinium pilosum TaxID=2952 RepID=A0A812SVJ8_SYMPI|nr:unnamed protein product [Symbiodinium pilosum]